MNYTDASSNKGGAISKTEDIVATCTYEELSMEFKKLYPVLSRAFHLIGLMYNRLTMEDNLSHKEAISKIYDDHKHLQGFSRRNIRRSLMSLANPNIPHRSSQKIRPIWPNSDGSEESIGASDRENAKLSYKSPVADQNYELEKNLGRETDCSNCNLLTLQIQKQQQEKNNIIEGLEQALQLIQKQEQMISRIRNTISNDGTRSNTSDYQAKVLGREVPLLYVPLQQAMVSTFKLKENKQWLTITIIKDTGHITAVYTGRKSQQASTSTQSILSSD